MDMDARAQAHGIVEGYTLGTAAPLILWGVALVFVTPALVALAWVTGESANMFTGSPATPNGFVMLLAGAAGVAAAITLVAGCWRAAKNADYVAAATYLQAAETKRMASSAAGTSPH